MSSKLTVAQLREELKERGLDTKGLKALLVARLDQAIADEEEEKGGAATTGTSRKRDEEQDDEDLPPASKRMKPDGLNLKKMTVANLRAELSDRGLATTGRKQELLDRLETAIIADEEQDRDLCTDDQEEDAAQVNDNDSGKRKTRGRAAEAKTEDEAEQDDQDAGTRKRRGDSRKEENRGKAKQEEEEEVIDLKMVKACKKGRAVLDETLSSEIKSSYHVLEIGGDVYTAMLNFTDVGCNNNKFYGLQVLESDDKSKYSTYFRWGRVGEKGMNQLRPGSMDSAIQLFEKKFKEKTCNNWSNRHNFVPRKYVLLEMDYENASEPLLKEEKMKKKAAVSAVQKQASRSKLDSRVGKFLSLICNISMMKNHMVEIGYDARKLPLGKLSKATILKGYEVLKRIAAVLETGRRDSLMELSSEFYTIIPHDFGRADIRNQTIDTTQKLQRKAQMVEALGEIQIATQLLADDEDEDDPLYAHYKRLQCKLEPLEYDGEEYKWIGEYLKNTHGETHSHYDLEMIDVFKVQRDGEEGRFTQYADTPNRMLLWHGSRLTNWTGILSQGLRIAPPEAPSTGYMFGKGVYFADMVSKSANYCCTSSTSPTGVLLLCEVALGEMKELVHADYNADKYMGGKVLSTKGVGLTFPDESQAKTLPDRVVVPLGKPKNSQPSSYQFGGGLQYNEYIVYKTNQIRMRYVLQVRFNYKYR